MDTSSRASRKTPQRAAIAAHIATLPGFVSAQQLHEAANDVAQEKWTFDKPELPEKAAEKLEEAREAAVKAEELMEKAAQATEKTPFAAFAKEILSAIGAV